MTSKSSIKINKSLIIAALLSAVLFSVYQFYPPLNQMVGWSLLYILPGSMLGFMIAPLVVAALLSMAIIIINRLAGAKNAHLVGLVGFAFGFLLMSLLMASIDLSPEQEVALGLVLAFAWFLALGQLMYRVKVSDKLAVIIGVVALITSVFATPLLIHPIQAAKITNEENRVFQKAVSALDFSVYYPTFQSKEYPVSSPMLYGYDGSKYTKTSLTFTLGKAKVKQQKVLQNQHEVMNFSDHCDILELWSIFTDTDSLQQRDIDSSKERQMPCQMIHKTPDGKEVYFYDRAGLVFFYIRTESTNIIIRFDDDARYRYDPGSLPEMLRVIDSLELLDKSKIEKGSAYGDGF
ncbi:MAG TPA: hypothetical protein VFZ62_02815 [Candidatus Saccharimonadales bacterium]